VECQLKHETSFIRTAIQGNLDKNSVEELLILFTYFSALDLS